MLTKSNIARYLSKETTASKPELVQFFHSNFYEEGLDEDSYLDYFIKFKNELDLFLLESKDWSIDNTFLKGKISIPPKLPKKVRMEMEKECRENQAYIKKIIKQINEN